MAIPKFFMFMKPFLSALEDEGTYSLREMREKMANHFNLTAEDKAIMLPSKTQAVYANRVQWASTYLFKAGLIEKPARGMFRISVEGKEVLRENPEVITPDYLTKYEAFRDFQGRTNQGGIAKQDNDETPDDTFEDAFEKIHDALADELLTEVMKLSPVAFEKMIIDLMQKMGYGAFENAGRMTAITADEGIDGVIMQDKLGFDLIYIQAKHWALDHTVGRPEIQSFVGAISGKGGNGLFVTTSKYAKTAIDYAEQHHIILIDGKRLCKLMIEHDFGVSVKKTFQVKELDTDVFNDYANI